MSARLRLLRSALFCPANNRKILNKTASLRPDAFIYDLEDAVTLSAKISARGSLSDYFAEKASSSAKGAATVAVRVNCPLSTEWGASDIAQFSKEALVNAIVLPKVEGPKSIDTAMSIIKASRDPTLPPLKIWAMIETARGVLNAEVVCDHDAVEAIVFGSNDLTKDIRAIHMPDRSPLLFSMSKCVLAARAAGKYVLDGVFNDFTDHDSFAGNCILGRRMGFDGKSLIHPSQIGPAHTAYSPSEGDIAAATAVVQAWDDAMSQGKTVAVVGGRLVEELHVIEAKEVLDLASFIQERGVE